jgi:hypothetical protein
MHIHGANLSGILCTKTGNELYRRWKRQNGVGPCRIESVPLPGLVVTLLYIPIKFNDKGSEQKYNKCMIMRGCRQGVSVGK